MDNQLCYFVSQCRSLYACPLQLEAWRTISLTSLHVMSEYESDMFFIPIVSYFQTDSVSSLRGITAVLMTFRHYVSYCLSYTLMHCVLNGNLLTDHYVSVLKCITERSYESVNCLSVKLYIFDSLLFQTNQGKGCWCHHSLCTICPPRGDSSEYLCHCDAPIYYCISETWLFWSSVTKSLSLGVTRLPWVAL